MGSAAEGADDLAGAVDADRRRKDRQAPRNVATCRGSGIMSPNKANRLSALGGMTPQMDYDFLERAVVSAIYGPGTNIAKIAAGILSLIQKHRLAA